MIAAAKMAESLGFESVWSNELHRSPVVSPLEALSTARVNLGTVIAYASVTRLLSEHPRNALAKVLLRQLRGRFSSTSSRQT